MKEKGLLSISFLISTAGLLIIFAMGQYSAPCTTDIGSLDFDQVGYNVIVKGEVIDRNYHKDGHIFLTVKDNTGSIIVPIFSNLAVEIGTRLDDCREVEVMGKLEEYRDNLEVIPREPGDIVCLR